MLAISSTKYRIPIKKVTDGLTRWMIISRIGEDRLVAVKFNYTITVKFGDEFCERFTAHYDGSSVKPAARTLRVFGSERCQRVVSFLSSRDDLVDAIMHPTGDTLIFA